MAIRVAVNNVTSEYVLQREREEQKPTVFMVRRLRWEEKSHVRELSTLTLEQALKISSIHSAAQAEGRDLTQDDAQQIAAIQPPTEGYLRNLTQQCAQAVVYGCVDICGALDEDGEPVAITAKQFVEMGDAEDIREVGSEIIRISELSIEKKKL
ncbi:MAG: hypothetical protein GXP10_10655 [Gammaproteobacteria bacterium]|nr:hypothetical protein [Gammaproteobacteria bacterium]